MTPALPLQPWFPVQINPFFSKQLSGVCEASEARAMVWQLLEHVTGLNTSGLIALSAPLNGIQLGKIQEAVDRLREGEPLQYILGSCHFFGVEILVNRHTLIPRPETEELVSWILEEEQDWGNSSVLDLCTGSGCIAIALAKTKHWANVCGVDISKDAIALAAQSAANNHVAVDWKVADILMPEVDLGGNWDVLVANPPYVLEAEKPEMAAHVLNHEPATALFTPEADPVLFYREITRLGLSLLRPGGCIYFELNPLTTSLVMDCLGDFGYQGMVVRNDMQGRQRMLKARLGTTPA